MDVTKFVECPVVDKTPFLYKFLYKGQTYAPSTGFLSNFGIKWMTGIFFKFMSISSFLISLFVF